MKKIIELILVCFITIFVSCEAKYPLYKEVNNKIGFEYTVYVDTMVNFTFQYEKNKQQKIVYLKVKTMGFITDYDRPFVIEQIDTEKENQAIPGVHYVPFDDKRTADFLFIPAGKEVATIPIILSNDKTLNNKEVNLKISLRENEHFKIGIEHESTKQISFSNILTRPEYWNFYAINYFAGQYGKVKHQFMVDAMAPLNIMPDNDWFKSIVDVEKIDISLTDYWFAFFTRELEKENKRRKDEKLDVLREESVNGMPGIEVKFTQWE